MGSPGLVVALARPDLDVVLLDRRTRRTDFLSRAVRRLALAERVRVLPGDAATLAHDVRWRGHFGAAIARGLGSPAITAELCRGFVGDGGLLIVSEPPAALGIRRWSESGLASLGWAPDEEFPGVIRVRAVGPPPPGVPRRRPSAPRW